VGCCDGARWGGREVGVCFGGGKLSVLGWVGLEAEEGEVARLLPARSLVDENWMGIACGCSPVALECLSFSLMLSLAFV
jgi:hypothetical protein